MYYYGIIVTKSNYHTYTKELILLISNIYLYLKTKNGEYDVLFNYDFSEDMLPMIIIHEPYRKKSDYNTFGDWYTHLCERHSTVILDFPTDIKKHTKK